MKRFFMKKLGAFRNIFILFLIFSVNNFCFCEDFVEEEKKDLESNRKIDFVLDFGAGLYLNPESSNLKGAPSPVNFEFSFGAIIPKETMFSVAPKLTFFTMNHLWYEDVALPAEIENRTSRTLAFYLNIPFCFTLNLEKSKFLFSLGPGIMMQFAFLASSVSENDEGFLGSAKDDVERMNSWFWENSRWLYGTFEFSWLYKVTEKLSAGPSALVRLPVGTLISEQSFLGSVFSLGMKICF